MNEKEYNALLEVRDIVEAGHTVGTNEFLNYYCLVGAVNKVTNVSQENSSDVTKDKNRLFSRRDWRTRHTLLSAMEEHIRGTVEEFNDNKGKKSVLDLLDYLIEKNGPKAMEIGKPDKQYTIEPAEPIPGVKEQPSQPLPTPEPVRPEREKVPA